MSCNEQGKVPMSRDQATQPSMKPSAAEIAQQTRPDQDLNDFLL